MFKNTVRETGAAPILAYMHGFDLTVALGERLERPHRHDLATQEYRKEPCARGREVFCLQCMNGTRRRGRPHQCQMCLQERSHTRVGGVNLDDIGDQCVQAPRRSVAKFSPYPRARIFCLRGFGSCTTASIP